MSVEVRQDGSWRPIGGRQRGPTGLRVPIATPAYATPADIQVANTTELLAAIASLGPSDGGSVIEITGAALTGEVNIPNNTNASSWSQNILIRPVLGERCEASTLIVYCANLTFAGLDFLWDHNPAIASQPLEYSLVQFRRDRSGLWRCRSLDPVFIHFRAHSEGPIVDSFLCEFVQTDWLPNYTWDFCTAVGDQQGFLVDGCYVAPILFGIYDKDWVVGPTTYINPGRPFDYYNSSTIPANTPITLGTVSGDKSYGPPRLALLWYLDESRADQVTMTVSVNGSPWTTVALNAPDYRFVYQDDPAITRSFTAGDVITATFDKNTSGVHVAAGVDSTGSSPDADSPGVHGDVFQMYNSSGNNTFRDAIWRDSVVGLSSNNSNFQINPDISGAFVWDNCWIGRPSGNNNWGDWTFATLQEYVHGCDFQNHVNLGDDGSLVVFKNNTYGSRNTSTFVDDNTNTERGSALRFPDPPNLAALWPECPPS